MWTPARFMTSTAVAIQLAACATPLINPLAVNVAGVDRVQGESMEVRFVAHLRIQNPNENSSEFSGAVAELLLNGKRIGAGVTNQRGVIPGLGQVFVDIPITVTGLGDVRQAIGLYGAPDRKLDTQLVGQLTGSKFNDLGFEWRGELALSPKPQ